MRLVVIVEGDTEAEFVQAVLAPHLARCGLPNVSWFSVGGGATWGRWRRDIKKTLESGNPDLRITTMFDVYRLPHDFPGRSSCMAHATPQARVTCLETALATDIADRRSRLIPYLQLHEFESLVLASLHQLERYLDPMEREGLTALQAELDETPPEEVNHGIATAPSKRLEKHLPSYDKRLHGPLAVLGAGLPHLRATCPHFNDWLCQLEALCPSPTP
jgi:hypothetical protein